MPDGRRLIAARLWRSRSSLPCSERFSSASSCGHCVAYTIGTATVPMLLARTVIGFIWGESRRLPLWLVALATPLVGSVLSLLLAVASRR